MEDKKFGDPVFGSTLSELKAYAPRIATADGLRIEGPNHKVTAIFAAAGCLGDLVSTIENLRAEVAVLSEYRDACMAFNNSFGVETETLDQAVEIERAAEERWEAASQACWRFYGTKTHATTK